jgi:hypothetical protein
VDDFTFGIVLGILLGFLATAAGVLAPAAWSRWRQGGEPPPPSDWTSGRRKVPGVEGEYAEWARRNCTLPEVRP